MSYSKHEVPDEQKKLLKTFPRVEPTIKSHSAMKEFRRCPRAYFYSWVLGYKPRVTPPYFVFGSAYHKFQEYIGNQFLKDGSWNDDRIYIAGLQVALDYYYKHYPKGPPEGKFDHLTSTKLTLATKVAWDYWKAERAINQIEPVAIEQPFNIEYANGNQTNGRFDALVRWRGGLYIRDHKYSGKAKMFFERGVEPNDQVARYTFAASKLAGGEEIRGVIFQVMHVERETASEVKAKKVKIPTIYEVMSSRGKYQLAQWESDQEFMHGMIDASRQYDSYPMNESACTFCDYHIVCKQPNENGMTAMLKSQFKFKPYDNMNPDE